MNRELEIVREKVVLANNPHCSSLQEALDREVREFGCRIIRNDTINLIISHRGKGRYMWYHKPGTASPQQSAPYYFDTILGLPLTFERVAIALRKTGASVELKFSELTGEGWWLLANRFPKNIKCKWEIGKTFEHQDFETQKIISDFLT